MDKYLSVNFSVDIPMELVPKVPDEQLPEILLNAIKGHINSCSSARIYRTTRDQDGNITHLQFNLA